MFLHFFKRLQPGQITAHSGTDPNIRTDPVDYNFLMTSEETEIQANLRGELCQTTQGRKVKVLSYGAIFPATCNAILLLRDVNL